MKSRMTSGWLRDVSWWREAIPIDDVTMTPRRRTCVTEFSHTPRGFWWRRRTWRRRHDVTAMSRRRRGIIDGICGRRLRQTSGDNWTWCVGRDANTACDIDAHRACTIHIRTYQEPDTDGRHRNSMGSHPPKLFDILVTMPFGEL